MIEENDVKWLEDRNEKLIKLENMINNLQYTINDKQEITNINDIKMEIFKLWYFNFKEVEYQE